MKNIFKIGSVALLSLAFVLPTEGQNKSIKDYKLFLDPGHSKKENQGLYNYSEAEKTLRVALAIREYLYQYSDIDTVYMCRQTDNEQIELAGRTDMANALDVDFYYSIHSDAGTGDSNSTLTMYGGWKTDGVVIEKTPNGGKAFGEILNPDLNGVMKLLTRGNLADRTYYDSSNNHANKYAYLHVNRESNMASLLSEAGFHTNPYQQQRNLNAEYKRMEGLSAARSILEYLGVDRPEIGVMTGEIKDSETGLAVNGATVTVGGKTYTTDSYASLFNKYSTDPSELRNGFYFFEGLTPGQTYDVVFTSPEFTEMTKSITLPSGNSQGRTADNIAWLNVELVNKVPAKVKGVSAENLNSVAKNKPLAITFTRKMDKVSVGSAISISPSKSLSYSWADDYTLNLDINNLDYVTEYTLTINGAIAKNSQTNQQFDGDADGIDGGIYTLKFTTSEIDQEAPAVVSYDPVVDGVATVKRPFIRVEYDEHLDKTSIAADQVSVKKDGAAVAGTVKYYESGKKSVIHLYLTEDLVDQSTYTLEVKAGLKDVYGNETTAWTSQFKTNFNVVQEEKMIDNYETYSGWWHPGASGSTSGLDAVSISSGSKTVTASPESVGSAQLDYTWEFSSGKPRFIRWYLPAATAKARGTFDATYVVKVDLFADGSGNKFRFNIVDGAVKYETMKEWVVMNWVGWKTIEWDLKKGEALGWTNGNGVLDAGTPFYIDSYQFADDTNSAPSGTIYVDNFRAVKEVPGVSSIENETSSADVSIYAKGGVIKVEAQGITSINVYGLNGQLVKSLDVDADDYEIAGLAKGFYIVKANTAKGQAVEKVILK